MPKRIVLAAMAALALAACSDRRDIAGPQVESPDVDPAAEGGSAAGAVYTSTNAPGGNAVAIFARAADGRLTAAGTAATGGTGTGGGLGNQGAVVLARNERFLFVVNAGSNDISSFSVEQGGLTLVGRFPSGGIQPVSLTVNRNLLYVLNAGGQGNIMGFAISRTGRLTPIPGSARPLSGAATGPAQIEFSPDGDFLVVTEKMTNLIDVYEVSRSGLASGPATHPSNGETPFGFAFGKNGELIVSEAFGGAPDASAVSSYRLGPRGGLRLVSGSVETTETAACWIVVTNNGRFAYTTNTGSGSISGYRIGNDGSLFLLDADGRTGVTGDGTAPTDLALSNNSRYLYALNSGTGTVSAFRARSDGSLESLGEVGGLPANATGLAAR